MNRCRLIIRSRLLLPLMCSRIIILEEEAPFDCLSPLLWWELISTLVFPRSIISHPPLNQPTMKQHQLLIVVAAAGLHEMLRTHIPCLANLFDFLYRLLFTQKRRINIFQHWFLEHRLQRLNDREAGNGTDGQTDRSQLVQTQSHPSIHHVTLMQMEGKHCFGYLFDDLITHHTRQRRDG